MGVCERDQGEFVFVRMCMSVFEREKECVSICIDFPSDNKISNFNVPSLTVNSHEI